MNKQFLQQFANSTQWDEIKSYLIEYRDLITNVNDNTIVIDATNGEKFVGKQYAGKVLDVFIQDVDKYKLKKIIKKDSRDNMN